MQPEDFQGFDIAQANGFLRGFDRTTRQRGEAYFQGDRVQSITCLEPGRAYEARVQGGGLYTTLLSFDPEEQCLSSCSCPIGGHCKHTYAAMKQLLAEHSSAQVQVLSAAQPRPRAAKAGVELTPLSKLAAARLDRPLKASENAYLRNVSTLFVQAKARRQLYLSDLGLLGVQTQTNWYQVLDLWPAMPNAEAEFWNYLALYLQENGHQIPDFLAPVTDLENARDRMKRHRRGREIEEWKRRLDSLTATTASAGPRETVELRVRYGRTHAFVDWRGPGADWAEIKPGKFRHFEDEHGSRLGEDAALIWNSVLHRAQLGYPIHLGYADVWAAGVVSRWLGLPSLRPLLCDAKGEALVFSENPLRWLVTEPPDPAGDYELQLVQSDGQPAPDVWAAFDGEPATYLTEAGVFRGPSFEPGVTEPGEATRIPAKAFESAGGVRLLERLNSELPARLAARVRTVPLELRVVARVVHPWHGSEIEHCHLEILGASPDGRHVERWNGSAWMASHEAPRAKPKADAPLERIDRSRLAGIAALPVAAGFKYDCGFNRWTLRVTKKFPEHFVPFLQSLPAGTLIDLGDELASFQGAQVAGRIRLEATEAGIDWFDLRVLVDVNDASLSPEEIKLLLDAKGKWVRLGSKGWRKLEFALSEEEDRELARLGLTPHELTSEPQRLHALQLADRAARRFLPEETCARIERRVTELQARVTPEVPAAIRAEMRPYQREGFHFLAYLSTNRFGGILADDMGLGKTLQTLAWLAWLGDTAEAARGLPSLVVCPKSVADNWQAEAARFLPTLKVKVWAANELKVMPGRLGEAALHVVNYSQLRTVGEALARAEFLAVILDEGQYIKNPTSITGQIARRLRAGHRLVLSGTPIENRLLDLWSLMSFAMPGALGNRAEFGRLYDGKGDPLARQRLSARVRPFLIRRTKGQVARDLPDRIEEDLFCEIEGEQKTLYRAELKRAQQILLGVKTPAALNKQRFHFLTSLLRLRQICCHPRLVKLDSKGESAKLEAMLETLEPLMEEGQKVLVFSQFVEMLGLMRAEIETRGWPSWYLAGDTENRGDLVREFQAASGAGVFLISLKAGGFGLNLTAASYVILFDPWWNPAVENQAIDRTHRIGQTQKVIAYRLLIKNSIEEKIRALQKQKKLLAEDVLGEEKFSQSLSLDDLRYLLSD